MSTIIYQINFRYNEINWNHNIITDTHRISANPKNIHPDLERRAYGTNPRSIFIVIGV